MGLIPCVSVLLEVLLCVWACSWPKHNLGFVLKQQLVMRMSSFSMAFQMGNRPWQTIVHFSVSKAHKALGVACCAAIRITSMLAASDKEEDALYWVLPCVWPLYELWVKLLQATLRRYSLCLSHAQRKRGFNRSVRWLAAGCISIFGAAFIALVF